MAKKSTKINLGLIAAKVKGGEDESRKLAGHFRKHHWEFWGPATVKKKLKALADLDYENDVAVVASKILEKTK
jgi:cytochrome c551/c552